jgi:RHS repeat-associated protein
LFRDSIGVHSFLISASLGDLCALAVNLSSSRLSTDTYDANGNTLVSQEGGTGVSPVSSSSVTDVYSFDNKLIRRTNASGQVIDLTYNPDGHRLTKFITQNGLTQRLVHYLTDANNPTGYAQVIEEKQPLDTTSPLKKVNLYGHDLISSEERGTGVSPVSSIYYAYDGLGSVRSITDTTGTLQETYDYDAYGTLIGLAKRNPVSGQLESADLTNSINKPSSDYLYTGEQWDADLGMYFLRARYLNTNTGRFHSQDSYEGRNGKPLTLHKYLYGEGNPVNNIDSSGNMSLTEQSAVIGMMGGMASYSLHQVAVGQPLSAIGLAQGAIMGAVIGPLTMISPAVGLLGAGYGLYQSATVYGPILFDEKSSIQQRSASAGLIITSIFGGRAAVKHAQTNGFIYNSSFNSINPKQAASIAQTALEQHLQNTKSQPGFPLAGSGKIATAVDHSTGNVATGTSRGGLTDRQPSVIAPQMREFLSNTLDGDYYSTNCAEFNAANSLFLSNPNLGWSQITIAVANLRGNSVSPCGNCARFFGE